ncbi:MAG: chemotaxis protein CheX [Synergistaceae bacterium]|nr:chemotaxis protein CheX [Synergistaceae bacterium]
MAMKITLPADLVNSYVDALISVSDGVGITASFVKQDTATGIKAPGSRTAAIICIVGGAAKFTAALMADMQSFEAYVNSFTCGVIKADVDDSMSMSVLGEITNMVSGRALISANIPGLDITPPQLFSGENLRICPPLKSHVKCFTLPFMVNSGRMYLVLSVYD